MRMGPALLPTASLLNNGAATLRTISSPLVTVAAVKQNHTHNSKGIKQSNVAGRNPTSEYPYKQIHSTISMACMAMHCVRTQKRMGTPKEKEKHTVMALAR